LSEERAQMEAKREEQSSLLTTKIVTDGTFSRHQGLDLAAFDEKNSPLSDLPTFRIPRRTMYSALKLRVAQHFSYPEGRIRLWVLVIRQNGTVRPGAPIPEDQPSLSALCRFFVGGFRRYSLAVGTINGTMAAPTQQDLWLYLDFLPDPSKVGCTPRFPGILCCLHPHKKESQSGNPETTMVFLKHFDVTRQSLFGVGKINMPKASKVSDLIPAINERMEWASGTSLKFYEVANGALSPTRRADPQSSPRKLNLA